MCGMLIFVDTTHVGIFSHQGHMLWDNIIDLGKRYQFDIELDRPMERKKQLTAIRDEVQSGSVRSDSDSGESSMSPPG